MKKMDKGQILHKMWTRKIAMIAILAILGTGHSYGQVLVDEDFTGQTLPTGWTTDAVTNDGDWAFDNPGSRTISGGIPGFDADFAIFDSDDWCGTNEEATLTSPVFDASGSGSFILQFDNSFRNFGSQEGHVEVWDGTNWTDVLSLSGGSNGYPNPANHKSIDITSAAGNSTAAKVRFHWENGSCDYWWAIDNVKISLVTCFAPSGLNSMNITTSSADISWIVPSPTPTDGYQYYFNTTGSAPTSTTVASGSSVDTIITLSSLSGNTTYYAWVRSLCSATDTSDWSIVDSFTTLCSPYMAPWYYDVETAATTTSAAIEECWSADPANTSSPYRWNVDGSGSTPTANTGPSGAYSGSKYFYTESTDGSDGDSAVLTSPLVDVSGLTTPAVEFYYHLYGSDIGSLYIEVFNGASWSLVDSLIGEQQTDDTDPWIKKTIFLTGYADTTLQVRFTSLRGSGSTGDMALDDISVIEAPTCFEPTNIIVSNITDATADIAWTAPAPVPGNGYEYYCDTSSTAPDNTTPASGSVGAGVLTSGLSSLSGNTTYYVWVRSLCSATDTSVWSSSASFTTLCGTYMAPWYYDVENAATTTSAVIEECWSADPSGTSSPYRWNVDGGGSTPSSNTGPSGPYSGTNYFYTEASSGSDEDSASLTTPLIDVSGLTTPAVEFYYHLYGSDIGSLYIGVSDGTSWSLVDSIIGEQQTDDTDPWIKKTIILTGYTDTVQVRFISVRTGSGSSDYEGDMALDDISVIEAPTCFEPTNIAVSNITDVTADISWTAPAAAPGNGYEYYYNTSSTVPDNTTLASGSVGAGVLTASLGGLNSNTVYYVWVRSVCSATDTSIWSQETSFRTLQIPATLPYSEDFTTTGDNWTSLNGSQTNLWYVGNATGNPGNSLYISNDNGTSNSYSTGNITTAQVYRDIALTAGSNPFSLKFDWKAKGEGTSTYWDYFRVWIVPYDYTPSPGTQISSGSGRLQIGGSFNDPNAATASWHAENFQIPASYAGDTVRLVFEWRNDGGGGSQPPAAIDNVNVKEITCFSPTALSADELTSSGAGISWTAPASVPGNGYEYYYSTDNIPPTATTSASGTATGTTADLTGLSTNTQYYVWVRSVCSSTDASDWSDPVSFNTLQIPATLPYTEDFTTTGVDWTEQNGTQTNQWHVGNATGNSGNSLYISNNDGISNAYSTGNTSTVQAYRDVILTAGNHPFTFDFEWKLKGEGTSTFYDYLRVWVVPYTFIPVPGTQIAAAPDRLQIGGNFNDPNASTASWHSESFIIPPSFAGDTVRLVFEWENDNSSGSQPPAAIDNINVAEFICPAPDTLSASNIDVHSATLNWNGDASDNYTVEYGNVGFIAGTGVSDTITALSYDISGLTPNTTYDFYIRSICIPGMDTSDYSMMGSFTTLCDTPSVFIGNDTAICEGVPATLNAGNPGGTYLWNNATTNQTLAAGTAGTYFVEVMNLYGCVGSDTVLIGVNANPVVDLGPDLPLCEGASLVLDAGNVNVTYLWNTTATTQTLTVYQAGLYFVIITDMNHCQGSDTIEIIGHSAPLVNGITAVQNTNGSYDFTATGAAHIDTYLWDFGDQTGTSSDEHPNHSYLSEGNYTITLVITNDCGTDTITALLHYFGTGIAILNVGKDLLTLYPNPAKDQVTIRNSSNYQMEYLTVYNVLGQVVFKCNPQDAHQYTFDVSDFAPGLYNIRIKMNEGFVLRKFEVLK